MLCRSASHFLLLGELHSQSALFVLALRLRRKAAVDRGANYSIRQAKVVTNYKYH